MLVVEKCIYKHFYYFIYGVPRLPPMYKKKKLYLKLLSSNAIVETAFNLGVVSTTEVELPCALPATAIKFKCIKPNAEFECAYRCQLYAITIPQ